MRRIETIDLMHRCRGTRMAVFAGWTPPRRHPFPIHQEQELIRMLTVGDQFPKFNLKATVSNDLNNAFVDITNETYKGKWLVVFFYPKDFTFVCRSEEHTSELQSQSNLVCRLLLEKKKKH